MGGFLLHRQCAHVPLNISQFRQLRAYNVNFDIINFRSYATRKRSGTCSERLNKLGRK